MNRLLRDGPIAFEFFDDPIAPGKADRTRRSIARRFNPDFPPLGEAAWFT